MNILIKAVVFTAIAATISCSANKNPFQNNVRRPDGKIANSFRIAENAQTRSADNPLETSDRKQIVLEKAALEKEFLIQASLIGQQLAPRFSARQSRIVIFRLLDNKIHMIEASQGLTVTNDFPQTLLLASFPVLSETTDSVTFDFNEGMTQLFITGDLHYRDYDDGSMFTDYTAADVKLSYIESAQFTDNVLEIQQLAQVKTGLDLRPYRVMYYLTPYIPNAGFVPTHAPETLQHMGFFENRPFINNQNGFDYYAAKMDSSKPITYAISANTPADYKQAVKDGILYWNKAFEQDVIQVVDAPAGVVAPNPQYNIVQWVDWDSAGFAYADMQMDPRTGEILHHNVYFTSSWAKYGLVSADSLTHQPSQTAEKSVALLGFIPPQFCNLELSQGVTKELSQLALRSSDPAQLLKASQDLIREVVAHEVGHTLGLRHNFAGTQAANYELNKRYELFDEYLTSGNAPSGVVTSSSMMDYQFPLESMINGDQIAKGLPAQSYDVAAIQSLYFGKKYATSELPLYCADSGVGKYLDCMRYDAGESVLAWTKYSDHDDIKRLPLTIWQRYLSAKYPEFGEQPKDVGQVAMDPKKAAYRFIERQFGLLQVLTNNAGLLRIDRQFPFVNASNQDQVNEKFQDYVINEFNREGGLDSILLNTTPELAANLQVSFEELLSQQKFIKGTAPDGRPYEFTSDELTTMKSNSKMFFKSFVAELIKLEVKNLSGIALQTDESLKPFESSKVADVLASYFAERQNAYLFADDGHPQTFTRTVTTQWATGSGSEVNKQTVTLTLPNFIYPLEVRLQAAKLLSAERSTAPSWAYRERATAQVEFNKMMLVALSGQKYDVASEVMSLPKPVIEWVTEAQAVKKLLN